LLQSEISNPFFSVRTTKVEGVREALEGLALSYNQEVEKMLSVAPRLAHKGNGHNKFLESICVWQTVTAARDWWSQYDTYRMGMTKQSESTMHTITKRELTQTDFAINIKGEYLEYLNLLIIDKAPLWKIKKALPESFLQTRMICTNYMTLQTIHRQRFNHKLGEWHVYCEHMALLPYKDWLISLEARFTPATN
jgi:hypothetical protein